MYGEIKEKKKDYEQRKKYIYVKDPIQNWKESFLIYTILFYLYQNIESSFVPI
jgi:hypothetical protein